MSYDRSYRCSDTFFVDSLWDSLPSHDDSFFDELSFYPDAYLWGEEHLSEYDDWYMYHDHPINIDDTSFDGNPCVLVSGKWQQILDRPRRQKITAADMLTHEDNTTIRAVERPSDTEPLKFYFDEVNSKQLRARQRDHTRDHMGPQWNKRSPRLSKRDRRDLARRHEDYFPDPFANEADEYGIIQ